MEGFNHCWRIRAGSRARADGHKSEGDFTVRIEIQELVHYRISKPRNNPYGQF